MNRGRVTLVAHADWSVDSKKRWCACAILEGKGRYRAYEPERVVDPLSLLRQFEEVAGPSGCILIGFDFPIGLPHRYAEKAGITDFLFWLPGLGTGEWSEFSLAAETREQISLHRPFYPKRTGGTSREHLSARLGIAFGGLLRKCERAHPGRRAACPLFWTLGGQQVGKAALSGWVDVLIPALTTNAHHSSNPPSVASAGRRFAIWPFSGALDALLQPGSTVAVETYPAEFYARLGVKFSSRRPGSKSGKRVRSDRVAQAAALSSWAAESGLALDPHLERSIREGFGSSRDGEDRFDAVAGLFGMLDVLFALDRFTEPESDLVHAVEGWIFGQDPGLLTAG